jgi:hypothetical protein
VENLERVIDAVRIIFIFNKLLKIKTFKVT